jgi:heme A synthase
MRLGGFAKYAWSVLAFNLLVVVWGAYVRASGSGAGCGSHWPLCNGVILPRAPETATIIELTHRATSGIALLLVVGMLVWAWRAYPRNSPVRLGAGLSMALMLTEAGVGAGLVLFELVANDASVARAYYLAVHLLNTFLLLASIALTAWWASGGPAVRLRRQGAVGVLLGAGLLAVLSLGITGAVTALGDTLFPSASLAAGMREDFSPAAHFLIRLRVLHPLLAVAVGAYLVLTAALVSRFRPGERTRRLALALGALFLLQLGAGITNLLLLAPIPLQLVHLLLADAVWLTLVLLTASALAEPAADVAVTATLTAGQTHVASAAAVSAR